eukprot:126605_1
MSNDTPLKNALSSVQGKIDEKLVFGFIRETNCKNDDFPDMFGKIIFLYFFIQELFDESNFHTAITIWNNGTIMRHRYGSAKSSFGTVWISSNSNMICTWTFIIKYKGYGMAIGLSSKQCSPTVEIFEYRSNWISYCCSSSGHGYRNDTTTNDWSNDVNLSSSYNWI